MSRPAPRDPTPDTRYTSARYFALVDEGALTAEDHVELLEGVVVAMAPQDARHAAAVTLMYEALRDALRERAATRMQLALVLGHYSVPEPDVAVVSGSTRDYCNEHPRTALLVVEVAATSVPQDRLTKAAIYAGAGIPEYWLVNLRDGVVEVFRSPDPKSRRYRETFAVRPGERLTPRAFPDVSVAVDDVLARG